MYYKGGNMIHYMRQLFRDDERFRLALRAMNDTFRHATVTYDEVVGFWSRQAGMDLSPLFHQYLRTTQIPTLSYRLRGRQLEYRWTNCIAGYDIPVQVELDGGERIWLHPTTRRKSVNLKTAVQDLRIASECYALSAKE